MSFKMYAGSIALGIMMGLGVLAGGVLVQTTAASGPVLANQLAQATPTAAPNTEKPIRPNKPFMHGGGGPGAPGKFGGPGNFDGPGKEGRGPQGDKYSANGATRVISGTTGFITLVKGDLAYANGKMDTATVQDWLNRADNLIKTAQSASSSNEYERAIETANAAQGLARAADLVMQQALGADKLPSYTQRPFPGKDHMQGNPQGNPTVTITQAQSSRKLAGFYSEIIAKQAQLKGAINTGDASTYLTAAQNYYRTAYAAYQAGKYNDAQSAVMVGQTLLGVVENLVRAGAAPKDVNTPVQVPAPNF